MLDHGQNYCDLAELLLWVYSVCQLPRSEVPHLSHRCSMKRLRLEKWLTAALSAAVGHTTVFNYISYSVHIK